MNYRNELNNEMTIVLLFAGIFILGYLYQKMEESSEMQDIFSIIIGLLLLLLIHILSNVLFVM